MDKTINFDDIAIIGMAIKAPGADTLDDFWHNLVNCIDSGGTLPKSRKLWLKKYLKYINDDSNYEDCDGAYIENISEFDNELFNILPKEAELMDPNQRLFLQTSYLALENAGYSLKNIKNSNTGVYLGYGDDSDYYEIINNTHSEFADMAKTANLRPIIASRLSYLWDLKGPSMIVDTTCSSSLVAIHLSSDALKNHECDMAIAGGIKLSVLPNKNNSKLGVESENGRTRTFDNSANGTTWGEGVGVVILKRLKDAIQDSDNILAVIKGSMINQDGKSAGITAPSQKAQEELISNTWKNAKINPEEIDYIEAHGTGTILGDPIEIEGLRRAFNKVTKKKQFCAIGSTKPNVGHTVHAAGVISLIKVILSIKNKTILPLTNFKIPNDNIMFEKTALFIPSKKIKVMEEKNMLCCISSFGMSGTNVHLVVQEYESSSINKVDSLKKDHYLVLSARSLEDVKSLMDEYLKSYRYLRNCNLDEICYTSCCCRNHYEYRAVIKFNDFDDLYLSLNNKTTSHIWYGGNSIKNEKDLPEIYISFLNGADCQFYDLFSNMSLKKVNLPNTVLHKKNHWINLEKLTNNRIDETLNNHLPMNKTMISTDIILVGKSNNRYTEIERVISSIISQLTGLLTINIVSNLGELGGDSILFAKLIHIINEQLDANLKISDLFSNPSVFKIGQLIENKKEANNIEEYKDDDEIDDIAIIGVSAKLPDADNIFEFWNNLINKKDCITSLSMQRELNCKKYLNYIKSYKQDIEFSQGGYMKSVENFDYSFFNISPKEAELMDPHQRILLEEAWKALIDAGHNEDDVRGSNTSVYIGYTNDFRFNYWKMINDIEPSSYAMAVTPNLQSIIPSRISYLLDLKGPSMLVDTACSSSLVAIHMACEDLKNGKSNMAISGGIRINLLPVFESKRSVGIESPTFSLRAFDDSANGTVWGEGAVVFILKRLKDARNNNDHIYAVIKGSSINQDGTSAGISAPNPAAQTEVITKCWDYSGINPRDIDYIECHGTGTNLGDPLEIDGIQNAFEKYTKDKQFCGIGSVKSSIGHLDAVSGAASLLKVILSMNKKILPGNINFEIPNQTINLEKSPLYFLKNNKHWKTSKGKKKVAGISSFGFSGTNCHMVIQESPEKYKTSTSQKNLFILSAKTVDSLWNLLLEYRSFLVNENNMTLEISNICYTLCTARKHYKKRVAIIVNDLNSLKECIQNIVEQGKSKLNMRSSYISPKNFYCDNLLQSVASSYLDGENVEWSKVFHENLSHISLPTYAFEKNHCWINIPNKETINQTDDEVISKKKNIIELKGKEKFTNTEEKLGEIWFQILGEKAININQGFYELGGHSITMMEIINLINDQFQVDLKFSEFNDNDTICKLATVLDSKNINRKNKLIYPEVIPEMTTIYEKFPLTDIQMSYFLGRQDSFEMGGVCTHVYMEVKSSLDIQRLEKSLNKVIKRHPMLQAIVEKSGEQRILKQNKEFLINVKDISQFSDYDKSLQIDNMREKISHNVFKTDVWPLIGVTALKLDSETHYLFIEFDMLIADGSSLQIIGSDWMKFYNDETLELPELKFIFKDYMRGLLSLKNSETYVKDKKFWLNRLDTFPDAPKLNYLESPEEITKPTFKRLAKIYCKKDWDKLKKRAQQYGVTPSALLCAAFAEILAYWSNQPHLAINLTVFNRYPFNDQVNEIVGDFTSVMLVEIDLKEQDSFTKRIKNIQKEILTNLEHRHYDGVEFIREIATRKNRIGEPVMPIVFTSMLFNEDENPWDQLGKTMMGLSQTPQVYLDHQAGIIGNELVINWDYVSEIFSVENIESMFNQYTEIIEYLINEEE